MSDSHHSNRQPVAGIERRDDAVAPADIVTLNRLATAARLLSGAAHEVNNALQVIAGTVELLEGRHDLPEPVVKSLERIRGQSTRAATALDGVLRFLRQSAELRSRVSLRDLAAQSVTLRTFAARRAGLALKYTPCDVPLTVEGNPAQLQQALLNMIINAEQIMAGHGAGAAIVVEAAAEPPWAVVRVIDEGPGVHPELAQTLFDPFVTSKPRPDSVGLGLSAARAVAEGHGGTLTLEEVEKGAVFVLRVPLAP